MFSVDKNDLTVHNTESSQSQSSSSSDATIRSVEIGDAKVMSDKQPVGRDSSPPWPTLAFDDPDPDPTRPTYQEDHGKDNTGMIP